MVSLNLRKFNKRIKHIKFGPYYMVALNKWDKGEQLFTFIDGKTYRDSEVMTLAKKYGYNNVERVYETYNSLG
jgi:hypothetical protein|tara:strand:+ start:1236 stop:1454 length:219 start_codon:yes stop_codon:yes gene_type:complete